MEQYDMYYESSIGRINEFLSKTFCWMFFGLMLTFGVAYGAYKTGLVLLFCSFPVLIICTVLELFLVFRLSSGIRNLSSASATRSFIFYSLLNGVVFSAYFLIFDLTSMIFCFASACVYFGVMAFYGARTEQNLSSWGPKLSAALIALLVISLLGIFFGGFGVFEILYCGLGLIVFLGLTAYDTQKLTQYCLNAVPGSDEEQKAAIYGALSLYLDFINIFIYILRLMGRRRD